MANLVSARFARRSANPNAGNPHSYWQRTHHPLQSLIFLFPLILLYELGTIIYARDPNSGETQFILARSLLRNFFEWFGVTGYYLPGLIVVVVLLSLHLFRKDPWNFQPRLYAMMWVESVLLALPLFVLLLVLARQQPMQAVMLAGGIDDASWKAKLIFSMGAGIYEELLFRLIAIALIHMVIVDLLALPDRVGAIGAIGLSSIAFALYHFPTWQDFQLAVFLQYTLAGVYLAAVYLLRGFGIVAATHALYDILVVLLGLWADRAG